jgi:hypothetical protein
MANSFGPPGQFGPPPGSPPGPPGPPGPNAPFDPPGPPRPPGGNDNAAAIVIIACAGVLVVGVIVVWLAFFRLPFGSDDGVAGPDPTSSSYSSGGSGSYDGGPSPGTSTAAPDPTASAFDAISTGDCLELYDTGDGGESSVKWSEDTPPDPVSCSSDDAMVKVNQITEYTSSCKTGTGESYWDYQPVGGGETKVLCLTRVYQKGYCLLGESTGDPDRPQISLGSMTAVECTDTEVPVPYNQIMHITGVYDAPAGASADDCVRSSGDQTLYWAWTVDDGSTLLCTKIFKD